MLENYFKECWKSSDRLITCWLCHAKGRSFEVLQECHHSSAVDVLTDYFTRSEEVLKQYYLGAEADVLKDC